MPAKDTAKDVQANEEQFIESIKTSLDDAEKLLREAADATGDKAAELRDKAMRSLRRTREALYDTQDALLLRGRQAVRATDDYVHDNPWQSIGIAGLTGLLVGMPLAYLPPSLPWPADTRYVGVNWFTDATRGHRLYDAIEQAVRTHQGPQYVLISPEATPQEEALPGTLLPGYRAGDCRPVISNLERDRHGRPAPHPTTLCRMVPVAGP